MKQLNNDKLKKTILVLLLLSFTVPVFVKVANGFSSKTNNETAKREIMEFNQNIGSKIKQLVSKEEILESLGSADLILDVRTPAEFAQGHIKGAKLIPISELQKKLDDIKKYKDSKVFVYCRSGNRSMVASRILVSEGFKDVENLTDGIIGFKRFLSVN